MVAGGGRDSLGVWDGHVCTAISKWKTNKDLLYSTREKQSLHMKQQK